MQDSTESDDHEEEWTRAERALLERLDTPEKIQKFLDSIPYNTDLQCRSPRRVMRDRVAHCMEGALFTAAAMRYHDQECLLLDLVSVRDDDHVVALFKRHGRWGAVGKSNFSGLRFREPVYSTLRELVMSYFENFFNKAAEKTLRCYSHPFDMRKFDDIGWMTTEKDLNFIGHYIDKTPHIRIMSRGMVRSLNRVDKRLYGAGMVGVNPRGLFKGK